MKSILLYFLSLLAMNARSQSARDPLPYAESISSDSLKQHLYILAGADMQGRETATPGQHKAAAYIEQEFARLGLLPGWEGHYQQNYPVFQDSLSDVRLMINDLSLRKDTDFIVSRNSTAGILLDTKEVLFVGYGQSDSLRDDYRDLDVKGKIVLVMPNRSIIKIKGRKVKGPAPDLYTLQEAAKKNGAAALLIGDRNFPRQASPDKGAMYVKEFTEEVPDTYIISDHVVNMILGKDAPALRRKYRSGMLLSKNCQVHIQLQMRKFHAHLESSNVIGYLEGSDKKEEAIIISAHYDHLGMKDSTIYYGADDDGTGTVTVIELARAFAKAAGNGIRPRRTILFMTVSGEEEGLWGSSYYVEHPAFSLEKTSADLNIDMIGRVAKGRMRSDTLNYIFVVGDNRLSSDLRPISESVNKNTSGMELDYKFNSPKDPEQIYYRSDHYNFAKKGVPVIFYFSGLHADYHLPTDTPDKINYGLLQKRARLIFNTAWEIANREQLLKRDIPFK